MADETTKQAGPNVFLCWSGPRSGAVARALWKWLPTVIQQCRPWMSENDIYTGKLWRTDVAQRLYDMKIGVICLTAENVGRPWINFEAGALSRQIVDETRVCPYCFGLKPTDYGEPLGAFNGVEANREGTLRLVRSINSAMERPIGDGVLEETFAAFWPKLEAALKEVPPTTESAPPKRLTDDMVREILELVRGLRADGTAPLHPALLARLRRMEDDIMLARGFVPSSAEQPRDVILRLAQEALAQQAKETIYSDSHAKPETDEGKEK